MKPSRWFAVAAFSFLTGGVARFSGEGGGAGRRRRRRRWRWLLPPGVRRDCRRRLVVREATCDRPRSPIGRSKTDTQLGHNVRVTLERRRT
ncbi:hypothetical protein BPC006_I0982 [Burkholderia pseudomallei BPC006]|uniref:Uncharacterized protein n=1 Tax=Burkholderia pseudomallei (strain 1106a) TaxID=357348 RepID=A3NSF3_BURP0|nr:conserved hypothetical protein [Burkholderia pseudomallei 1106a]AFR14869.1 hypothetical protein BPC006_I0982 [Burkholderia pseudomallei BPC006]AUL56259.1 hypothetical protein BHT10_10505 [Burkholderia pseudomallei]